MALTSWVMQIKEASDHTVHYTQLCDLIEELSESCTWINDNVFHYTQPCLASFGKLFFCHEFKKI